jgi:hypothetical protein
VRNTPSPRPVYPLAALPDGHRLHLLLRDVGRLLPRHGFPVIEQEADALVLRDALCAFLLDRPGDDCAAAGIGDRYPLPPRGGDDLRIVSLVGAVADALPDYGFPALRSVDDHTRLAAALHAFLYRPKQVR